MSEFDEEAEREKLRRQFEHDEKKREETARMSELLLQGATMTDTHCETCGDPLFRHDGTEFCPTCQENEDSAADGESTDPERSVAQTESPDTTPSSPSPPADSPSPPPTPTETDAAERPDHNGPSSRQPADTPHRTNAAPAHDGSLSEARTALEQTITRFATQAAAIEDPERARSYLEAVEDAATALRALDGSA